MQHQIVQYRNSAVSKSGTSNSATPHRQPLYSVTSKIVTLNSATLNSSISK